MSVVVHGVYGSEVLRVCSARIHKVVCVCVVEHQKPNSSGNKETAAKTSKHVQLVQIFKIFSNTQADIKIKVN